MTLRMSRAQYDLNAPSAWVTGPKRASFSYHFGPQPSRKWYLGVVGPAVAEWDAQGLLPQQPWSLRRANDVIMRLPALRQIAKQHDHYADRQRALLLEELLLLIAGPPVTAPEATPSDWANTLIHSFTSEAADPPDVDALAKTHGCSAATIRRRFSAATGTSILQAWHRARMTLAATLLTEAHDSISDIAKRCGYQDPLYFSRLFNRHFDISPRTFRQQIRGAAE